MLILVLAIFIFMLKVTLDGAVPRRVLELILTRCAAQGLKPQSISNDFSHSSMADLTFFGNFCQSGPISKEFSTSKKADFTFKKKNLMSKNCL